MLRIFLKTLSYNIFIFLFLSKITYSQIINKIEITGNERVPDETIKMLSNIEVNTNVDQNDINNLIKNLYDTDFFENIKIEFNENVLKIVVKENPIISSIKIRGIKAKRIKKSIIETLSLREKSSFNEIVLISEKAKILNLLKNMGYIQANLSILKETIEDNKLNLIFDIDLGEKAKIKK
ncbi:outer membrane protein assembly factor BamA, partial [Candidatus Pelagibacter sp.]|nr:outer membrane protein assembly factor BamA [Candidatus Pelagibacter sp.]